MNESIVESVLTFLLLGSKTNPMVARHMALKEGLCHLLLLKKVVEKSANFLLQSLQKHNLL